mmetsp:Transcript_10268/g.25163  ORF Transcript_10268/g.25163 Transcript_10268/m.25163 type:complete len:255 (-) Transcript_10268:492-1256(-)
MTEQRAWRLVTMPALLMEMDCCSIASWMLTRSWSFILSNSSMRHTPRSASTSAPPSSTHSRVTGSLCTAAVSPTAEAPLPVVYTQRDAVFSTYFRNWLLATPGSPRSSMLMSPRSRVLPLTIFSCPPNMARQMPILMSSCPWMDGAMDLTRRWQMRGSRLRRRISSLSSSVRLWVANRSPRRSRWLASTCVENTGKPCLVLRLASKLLVYTPVISTSSPGRAWSIRSCSMMISLLRGRRPAGTLPGDSCRVMRW